MQAASLPRPRKQPLSVSLAGMCQQDSSAGLARARISCKMVLAVCVGHWLGSRKHVMTVRTPPASGITRKHLVAGAIQPAYDDIRHAAQSFTSLVTSDVIVSCLGVVNSRHPMT